MSESTTVTHLLDTAEELARSRGYNAFSYKDLAESVGIRTASIHYHFKAKADLGKALVDRYRGELEEELAEIDRKCRTNRAKLKRFIALYHETESRGAICLCGSLASDHETLPDSVQSAVLQYLEQSERWIVEKLEDGLREEEFGLLGKPKDAAATLLAGLQGGLILARAKRGGGSVIDSVQRTFFANLLDS